MCKGTLCRRASISIGALLGNLERFVYWDFSENAYLGSSSVDPEDNES